MQVNELPGMASQPSFNPNNALASYNFDDVMFDVEYFFSHPTRGLGIELLWVRKDFTAFGEQYTPDGGLAPLSPNRYRFNGNIFEPNHYGATRIPDGLSLVAQDNRLITPPYRTTQNEEQYRAYRSKWGGGSSFIEFLAEARDPQLEDFVKLLLVDRRGEAYFDASNGAEVRAQSDFNALAYTTGSVEKQGTAICVAAMADEKYKLPNGTWADYDGAQFINQLIWAIAHEIGHLITTKQIADPSGHLPIANALMTNGNPAPLGITAITSPPEELLKINLKNRLSVQHRHKGEKP